MSNIFLRWDPSSAFISLQNIILLLLCMEHVCIYTHDIVLRVLITKDDKRYILKKIIMLLYMCACTLLNLYSYVK